MCMRGLHNCASSFRSGAHGGLELPARALNRPGCAGRAALLTREIVVLGSAILGLAAIQLHSPAGASMAAALKA